MVIRNNLLSLYSILSPFASLFFKPVPIHFYSKLRPNTMPSMSWKPRAKKITNNELAMVELGYVYKEETHLTVRKTSFFFSGDGFAAYDSKGELVFRVDSYGPDAGEVVLMDASGGCILTLRRKRPSLHQRWEGFAGERTEGQDPLFSVRRSSLIGRSAVTVEVYNNRGEEYHIQGSFACRSCNIFNAEKEAVAKICRKVDASTNVLLGKDVFLLSLKTGFGGAFAMALILVLDQIAGDGAGEDADGDWNRVYVDPANKDLSYHYC